MEENVRVAVPALWRIYVKFNLLYSLIDEKLTEIRVKMKMDSLLTQAIKRVFFVMIQVQ